MIKNECRESLFEIWSHGFPIGNGGIVQYPGGSKYFVTAKHVVFEDGGKREKITLKTGNGQIFPGVKFVGIPERDIALAPAPDDLRALLIASFLVTQSRVWVCGSIASRIFELPAIIIYAGKELYINQNAHPRKLVSTSSVATVHYATSQMKNATFSGTSGAIIIDRENRALGINTLSETSSHGGYFGKYSLGEVLGFSLWN